MTFYYEWAEKCAESNYFNALQHFHIYLSRILCDFFSSLFLSLSLAFISFVVYYFHFIFHVQFHVEVAKSNRSAEINWESI